jgi:CRISPR-associated protein Cas6
MSEAEALAPRSAGTATGASALDVAFALAGSTLPADHVDALACAVVGWLPWLVDEPSAGIHPLRAAATTHGLVALAQRAKLVLRVPASRAADSRALCGRCLVVGAGMLEIGDAGERPLRVCDTLYAQCVVTGARDERAFHDDVVRWLDEAQVDCEFIAGRERRLTAAGRELAGYALALHGLAPDDALRVQAAGIGEGRRFGCGLFVPHKAIATPASGRRAAIS